jgi:alkylated DNA repair dioxygenase AlkB
MEARELGDGARVALQPGFVREHAALMDVLVATLPLRREPLVLFGRENFTPRLTSWHGDPGCAYRYSGRTFAPHRWTPELAELRARLLDATGYDFNGVLANFYRDGSDSMGAHSDDERELGPSPDDIAVASLSLGARRRFLLERKHDGERIEYALGEGDLLLMTGTTQRFWKHRVPRTTKAVGARLNLTFRVLLV